MKRLRNDDGTFKKTSIKPRGKYVRSDVLIESTDNLLCGRITRQRFDPCLKLVSISSQNQSNTVAMVSRSKELLNILGRRKVKSNAFEVVGMVLSLSEWNSILESSRCLRYSKARFVYLSLSDDEIISFISSFRGTRVIDLSVQLGYQGNVHRVGPSIEIGCREKIVTLIKSVVEYNSRKINMIHFLICLQRQRRTNILYHSKGVLNIIFQYVLS